MSLIAHLRELRNRVALAVLFVAVATAVCFWWYDHGLGAFIRAPYCAVPADQRALTGTGGDCDLLVTDVFSGALIRLKIALIAGIVVSAPLWLHQIWRFITPGLKRSEKRYGAGFVAASSALFALGAVLAYYSLKAGLRLLIGLAGDNVAVALNLVGVLSYAVLKRSRRWIFFLTIVFAAFITPTQDPFTMLLMAAPMCLLFEVAIQIARVVDKRRARRDAAEHFHDVGDDEASPLDTTPSPVDEPVGQR